MAQKIVIIGGGFGGLAAACLLAKDGHHVTVLEKNSQLGGRAGELIVAQNEEGQWVSRPEGAIADGAQGGSEQRNEPYPDIRRASSGADNAAIRSERAFRFDTGPSWYLMPDVFDRFFESLGEKTSDYFDLVKLQPSYRVFFKDLDQRVDMTGDLEQDAAVFESIEKGAGEKLKKYLKNSEYAYNVGVGKFLYKNYDSIFDFIRPELIKGAAKLHILSNMDRYVRRYFKDPRLQKIMQYPLVFLGSSPYNAPALYNLMSHVDFNQGVFYPQGGMYKVVEALVAIGTKHGVTYRTDAPVEQIIVQGSSVKGVVANGETIEADVVISDADIAHTESALLNPEYRDHSEKYWDSRVLAPSALLMYMGVDRQYDSLLHHSLLFSQDWEANFGEIFDDPKFPTDPSIYVSATSKTDPSVAPAGHENIFVLVPLAPGLTYTPEELETYSDKILATMEAQMDLPGLRDHLLFKQLRCVDDFASRYNSYKGTGLGLAHTLMQTAIFRPSNKSKKVGGLFYVGANVHPGIGLPVTLISAQLAQERVRDYRR